jgi:hypothetical protein
MLRVVLKILLAAAAIAAVWVFVPIGGHTMSWRWQRAANPAEFLDRTWAELRGEAHPAPHGHASSRAQARGGSAGTRPSESHSAADHRELDQILSRHLGEH